MQFNLKDNNGKQFERQKKENRTFAVTLKREHYSEWGPGISAATRISALQLRHADRLSLGRLNGWAEQNSTPSQAL